MSLRRLVLDAGPLISLFYAKDRNHSACVHGFKKLIDNKVELIAPLPIIYEVHKWLLYNSSHENARLGLSVMMESLKLIYLDNQIFQALVHFQKNIPQWCGSLEDATVAVMSLQFRSPLWTLNYRDFGVFKNIEFWNP